MSYLIVYHLEINGMNENSHNSFEFNDLEDVKRLFSTLSQRFSNHEITMEQAQLSDFVQLTYTPVHLNSVQKSMASIVSEKLYSADVYEEMLTIAKELYKNKGN